MGAELLLVASRFILGTVAALYCCAGTSRYNFYYCGLNVVAFDLAYMLHDVCQHHGLARLMRHKIPNAKKSVTGVTKIFRYLAAAAGTWLALQGMNSLKCQN